MNASGYSPLPKNGAMCKNKWGTIYGDLKHTFCYMSRARNNTKYWELTLIKKGSF